MDFEKAIIELKKIVPLKENIDVNDIVLFILPDMSIYGIVSEIKIDGYKRNWWNISFTMLTIPLKKYTLTLRIEQMTGKEIFTIDGKQHFLSAVDIDKVNEKPKEPDKISRPKLSIVKKDNS